MWGFFYSSLWSCCWQVPRKRYFGPGSGMGGSCWGSGFAGGWGIYRQRARRKHTQAFWPSSPQGVEPQPFFFATGWLKLQIIKGLLTRSKRAINKKILERYGGKLWRQSMILEKLVQKRKKKKKRTRRSPLSKSITVQLYVTSKLHSELSVTISNPNCGWLYNV